MPNLGISNNALSSPIAQSDAHINPVAPKKIGGGFFADFFAKILHAWASEAPITPAQQTAPMLRTIIDGAEMSAIDMNPHLSSLRLYGATISNPLSLASNPKIKKLDIGDCGFIDKVDFLKAWVAAGKHPGNFKYVL